MANLFGNVLSGIAGSLLRSFSEGCPCDRVVEVKSDDYARQFVVDREDGLALYGPYQDLFDVVLQCPVKSSVHMAYSLYRTKDKLESRKKFAAFKTVIPLLLECRPELGNRHDMQSVCDLMNEHPSWTISHVAAHLGVTECFNHPRVRGYVNSLCDQTGATPLHVAVASQKLKLIQALLDADARLDIPDGLGNTVYHIAANTTKEIIQLLANKSATMINHRNIAGHTPLHVACLSDKPECVKALIYGGADVNAMGASDADALASPTTGSARDVIEMYPRQFHAKDMKHGGTPLHWAMSHEVVEALVELGCTVDARDFKGDTALHTMVLRVRLQCVIALLCYEADVDARNENSDTPLHLAVKSGNVSIVQALIVFGAAVNAINKSGDSARHIVATEKPRNYANILNTLHCVGAKRCEYGKNGCNEGCNMDGKYDGFAIKPTNEPRPRHFFDDVLAAATIAASLSRRTRHADTTDGSGDRAPGYRVLCLDGGGIRGLILVQMLIVLEEAVGMPLSNIFDWISGTSTGGILALVIAAGRSARHCQSVYFRLKNKVFNGVRPYDSKPFESFLQKELGEHTVMADIREPKVTVTGVLADRHPAELHLFRNYDSPRSLLGMETESQFQPPPLPEAQLMWRAARASGAAPTYFRAMGRFVDGGLIANNPTLDTMTEIHEYNCALKATGQISKVRLLGCIVSLGTGKAPVRPVKAIDVFCPDNAWDAAKMAFGMSALGNLLIDQATASDGRVIDRARAWSNMIDVPYFRFNPDLSDDVALDETKDDVLVKMLWETMVYMRSRKKDLSDLKDLLMIS